MLSETLSLQAAQPWALNAHCYVLGEEMPKIAQSEVYRMCQGKSLENSW